MSITSKPGNDDYRSEYERIFGKKEITSHNKPVCNHEDWFERQVERYDRYVYVKICLVCGEEV